jgi:hypothetical protein
VTAPKLAYNLTEAAAAVGLSPRTLKRAIAEGALRAKKSGETNKDTGKTTGVHVITVKALEEWLDGLDAA